MVFKNNGTLYIKFVTREGFVTGTGVSTLVQLGTLHMFLDVSLVFYSLGMGDIFYVTWTVSNMCHDWMSRPRDPFLVCLAYKDLADLLGKPPHPL